MKNLHFGEMEEGVTYFSSDFPYKDFREIKREKDMIKVSFIKMHDGSISYSVYYPIDIIHLIDGYQDATLEDLTLRLLEDVALELLKLYQKGELSDSVERKIAITT